MPKASKPQTAKSYRQMSDQLAELLAWFESGDIDLDQALAKYQQTIALIAEMEKYLKTAENQIRKLTVK